jgi:hypothetical protein
MMMGAIAAGRGQKAAQFASGETGSRRCTFGETSLNIDRRGGRLVAKAARHGGGRWRLHDDESGRSAAADGACDCGSMMLGSGAPF